MIKIMQAVPDLMVLINGLVAATYSVACTFFLIFCLTYVYAIILRQISVDTLAQEYYTPSACL